MAGIAFDVFGVGIGYGAWSYAQISRQEVLVAGIPGNVGKYGPLVGVAAVARLGSLQVAYGVPGVNKLGN
jgi:putative Mn2+ efflux pump MntP